MPGPATTNPAARGQKEGNGGGHGVRRCRPHGLRHTARILLPQGADLRVVMDVLGHTRMSTTSDLELRIARPPTC
ncbi:MAG: tyrosine-type recombinase/integrase [Candidatus Nanopelagicales bacterium]|nr:tyrosine-type recombinase/integrase [Candidatus Nanopelagicales bacterium]MCU0299572.1 tyrosine-type recombinase/integrase [Candidatus Nanopelagicales bacterium]